VEKDKKEIEENKQNIVKIGEYLIGFEAVAMTMLQKLFNGEFKNIFPQNVFIDKNLNLEAGLSKKRRKR